MRIITISRPFGSGGRELGKRLADRLNWDYYDREIIETLAREHGLDLDLDHLPEEVSRAVSEKIDGLIESHRSEIEYYF